MAEVFIVEDNLQHSRRIQQIVLNTGDHHIETFVDAGQAIVEFKKRIRERKYLPDLSVIDLNLPENSGHEILRFCKQTGACGDMGILVVSQRLSEQQASICRLMGAGHCVNKSASDEDLESAVRMMLGEDTLRKAS